jgi:D-alanine-D-alanine ligase
VFNKKIAVLWRRRRNIKMHEEFTGKKFKDDAFNEAMCHCTALKEAGYYAEIVQWIPAEPAKTLHTIGKMNPDLVFNASSEQEVCFCETWGIPYAGSGIGLVPLDKATRKKIWAYHGIPTPRFITIWSQADLHRISELLSGQNLGFPLFVKPVEGRGSSGITENSIVGNESELARECSKILENLRQPALIEEYIEGREISTGLIGNGSGIRILPLLEIGYTGSATNTSAHKLNDKEELICPAPLPRRQQEKIKELAVRAYRVLGARDYGRLDIMLKGSRPYFLELNTFAGIALPNGKGSVQDAKIHPSYMGKMAASLGKPQSWLVASIAEAALRRISA